MLQYPRGICEIDGSGLDSGKCVTGLDESQVGYASVQRMRVLEHDGRDVRANTFPEMARECPAETANATSEIQRDTMVHGYSYAFTQGENPFDLLLTRQKELLLSPLAWPVEPRENAVERVETGEVIPIALEMWR
jgi:hypothetical protein